MLLGTCLAASSRAESSDETVSFKGSPDSSRSALRSDRYTSRDPWVSVVCSWLSVTRKMSPSALFDQSSNGSSFDTCIFFAGGAPSPFSGFFLTPIWLVGVSVADVVADEMLTFGGIFDEVEGVVGFSFSD